MKVLVVDDDEMVRVVCAGLLNVMNHDVVVAESGKAAIRQIELSGVPFDVILLDDDMPEMSGKEMLRNLYECGHKIPVIICSGKSIDLEEFSVSPGYQPLAFLRKPFNLERLQTVLARAADNDQRK